MAKQIVLITGCSKGIGEGVALHLAKDPHHRYKVYATMRNLTTGACDIKSKAESLLDKTLFLRELDVTKPDTIDSVVKEIISKEGRIDVLVNNAGISLTSWWEDGQIEDFYKTMETNYFGCVRMITAVVPFMKKNRHGRVIQISSLLGFDTHPIYPASYTASKFALEGFSGTIAPTLRNFNIWVSLLEPGIVQTPMLRADFVETGEIFESLCQMIPGETGDVIREVCRQNAKALPPSGPLDTVSNIAEIVENIILSDKPSYRIQTSEFAEMVAKTVFVDPSGNEMVDQWFN